ncbi:MAG TPA: metal ABC transporter substrate-binding protein [Acidimicrobiales bacterium]
MPAARPHIAVLGLALSLMAGLAACSGDDGQVRVGQSSVVVTFPVLGSVVRDVVADPAVVKVLMPHGLDPHEWDPSGKDIAAMRSADLVVANGLGLEEGAGDALREVAKSGVPVFEAADHVDVRRVGAGEVAGDEEVGTEDPHLWLDPLAMRDMAAALAAELRVVGVPVSDTPSVTAGLEGVDRDARRLLDVVPSERRQLVTGHDSMGYFADRYDFTVLGSIVPSLTSQSEASAGALAELRAEIERAGVPAVFTELGTSTKIAKAVAHDAGSNVVELATHTLPADGTYRTFLLDLAASVAGALR